MRGGGTPDVAGTTGPRLVVGAVIVDRLDRPRRVLAARRTGPPRLAGRWEFPGGKVEAGETPTDALRRELLEELGCTVTLGTELTDEQGAGWPIGSRTELRLFFAVTDQQPTSGDGSHDQLRWLDADTILDVAWLDADRECVALLRTVLLADRPRLSS